MNIIKPDLKWSGDYTQDKLNLAHVDGIALHHPAHPTWDVYDVHAFHRDGRKWWGIGYNFFIHFDGTVFEGRGFSKGAGILNHNDHLIHVCFQGDYENHNTEMPDAQFNAGVDLIAWLKTKLPNVRVIHGHKYWASTACPGKYFPLTEMVAGKKRGVEKAEKKYSDVPDDHFAAKSIQALANAGLIEGYADGTFKPDQPVTRGELAVLANDLLYLINQKGGG